MVQDRASDIERGLALVPHLPEIMPDEAGGQLGRLYDDTRQTLRIPFVNFIFRVLANYQDYLLPEWDRLQPWAGTLRFEVAADALRSAALLNPAPVLAGADWPALGDLDRIRPFTDSIHYALPKLLLLVTAIDEGLDEQPRQGGLTLAMNFGRDGALPRGVASGSLAIPMVSPEDADPALLEVFDRIKRRHGHPGVATYYRSLGHWPAFLQATWERIEPLVGSPAYEAQRQILIEQALTASSTLPVRHRLVVPGSETRGLHDDLRAVLAIFRFRVIPDLLLDVTLVRAMVDGPGTAGHSRFSAAT
jgi:hypothetical protein